MHSTTRSPRSLWSKWPATTISALTGMTALVLVVATGAPTERSAAVPGEEVMIEEEAVSDEAAVPMRAESKSEPRAPSSKSKSGLYAMKGPKDGGAAAEAASHFAASPYSGAFAVGSDDADVWGGLKGSEIGESYGVGGLGLVGTGRGGSDGGTSAGYGRASRAKAHGSFDSALQARVLTVGTVDDNADAKAYATALGRLGVSQGLPGIDAALWQMQPPQRRHAKQPRALDVALVIDTTGSMGDELEYLKVELRDIATQVSRSYPGVTQRWGMVVYRDHGDDYVTRTVDFRDIDSFVTKLGQQQAAGGGDTPEAIDMAMDASAELSWHTGAHTARMVFLVADAPAHRGAAAERFAGAVLEHRAAGTAIYPVGASGVDSEAEAELRLAAKVTGGQYIFLTDHSGVGGHHAAPQVEQYKVETLHDAMTRMIGGELGGAAVAVAPKPVPGPGPAFDVPMPSMVDVEDSAMVPGVAPGPNVWELLYERLAGSLVFALSMLMVVLAGMGFDTLIHRWRTR